MYFALNQWFVFSIFGGGELKNIEKATIFVEKVLCKFLIINDD